MKKGKRQIVERKAFGDDETIEGEIKIQGAS